MKRELVSIAIIVLMVFTVLGTTVVTAAPANTATNPIYMVTPGVPSVWISPLFNYQHTGTQCTAPSDTATAHVNGLGQLTVTTSAVASRTTGAGVCADGVTWYLNPLVNWDAVKNKPVLVKVLMSYKLSGSGNGEAVGDVSLVGGSAHSTILYETGGAVVGPSYSINQPLKMIEWKTTLGALATQPGQGQLCAWESAGATALNGGSTQASTQVMVYSIEFQWT